MHLYTVTVAEARIFLRYCLLCFIEVIGSLLRANVINSYGFILLKEYFKRPEERDYEIIFGI